MIVTSEVRKHKAPDIFTGDMDIVRLIFICYIDNILHFSLDITDNVRFVHAYTDKNMYHIDITTYNKSIIELEYDNKDKWELILKELDKIL